MVRTNFEDRVSKVLRNMNMLLEKRIAAVAAADAASTVDAATTNAQHQATRISASGSTGGAFFTDAQKIEFLTKASSKLTRRQRSSRPAPLTTALEAVTMVQDELDVSAPQGGGSPSRQLGRQVVTAKHLTMGRLSGCSSNDDNIVSEPTVAVTVQIQIQIALTALTSESQSMLLLLL